MSNDPYLDEFPAAEDEVKKPDQTGSGDIETKESWIQLIRGRLSHAGLGGTVYRLGTAFLTVALILLAVMGIRTLYQRVQKTEPAKPQVAAFAAEAATPTPTAVPAVLPTYSTEWTGYDHGIYRLATIHTTIPSRPRTEIITYTVKKGDNIFSIADMFGLKPETILWGNLYTLADNPELIYEGTVLNIMPSNGTYHKWSAGEGLNGVAHGYNVEPDAIINWPGNHLDPASVGDLSHPNIEPGTMLFVPGGTRDFVTWSAPRISRDNPGVAKLLGPGSCGTIVDGAVGTGAFIWPAGLHRLSGYD